MPIYALVYGHLGRVNEIRVDMRTDMCVDMCVDICVDMHADMCVDMCSVCLLGRLLRHKHC